jgi:hypothetical protein
MPFVDGQRYSQMPDDNNRGDEPKQANNVVELRPARRQGRTAADLEYEKERAELDAKFDDADWQRAVARSRPAPGSYTITTIPREELDARDAAELERFRETIADIYGDETLRSAPSPAPRPAPAPPPPEPKPPGLVDEAELRRRYDATLSRVKRWQRDAHIREIGDLHHLRQRMGTAPRDIDAAAWCKSIGIVLWRWYYDATLSAKLNETIDEDNVFGTQGMGRWPHKQQIKNSDKTRTLRAERFPTRFYPPGESEKDRRNRRRRIYYRMDKRKGEAMLNQEPTTRNEASTPPRIIKIEALRRVLTKRMKLVDAAARVRKTEAWRRPDGTMLTLRGVMNKLRELAQNRPEDFGYEVVVENGRDVAYIWRR